MHIPDGFISAPINVAAFAASAAVCGAAVRRANRTLGEREIPLLGVTAAFIFAAQMVNFPVMAGTSGHFLGAVLAAVLLGPLNACLILALVLVIQCLLFSDGGITALGSNIFNMGIAGGIGGYAIFYAARMMLPKSRAAFFAAAGLAAWASIVLAASCCAVELALSGTAPLWATLPAMAGVHAVIGVGEAVITCATLSVVMAARPDLIGAWRGLSPALDQQEG